jgi:nitrilase
MSNRSGDLPSAGQSVRVAVAQAGSVLFDGKRSTDKAVSLIRNAGERGARLVLLPEAFIPGYPRGLSFGMRVGSRSGKGRELWQLYRDNAIDIPGPETDALGEAAREAGVLAAVGLIERDRDRASGTLYCTLVYFGPDGSLLGKHRKLKPTGSERLIWGEGDGSGLIVLSTELGRIGGLICWENYMPLARMALFGKGVEIYLAPTADARDSWQASLRHIACEGRCFVLGANQFVTRNMYPPDLPGGEDLAEEPEVMCRGGSAIVGPLGEILAGPVFDREEMLVADLDLSGLLRAKLDFDVIGHYARPDVFQLTVDETPRQSVRYPQGDHQAGTARDPTGARAAPQ